MAVSAKDGRPRAGGGTRVELCGLSLRVAGRVLLEPTDAEFEPGQVTLIVGPSGAGKSLLLRAIAGLLRPNGGGIAVSGRVAFDGRQAAAEEGPPSVGVVFQSFALFDELSPVDNVRFARAHRAKGVPRSADAPTVDQLLAELDVPRNVRTASLSGGQRQRLALARTLAYEPDVVLYDEPTSGLDAATAGRVATLIQGTHATHPKTSILVTHDYESLAPIADAVYLLDPESRSLRRVDREAWPRLREQLRPAVVGDEPPSAPRSRHRSIGSWAREGGRRLGAFFVATSRVLEAVMQAPLRLVPRWKSAAWGVRFLLHYLRLAAGPSAWLYLGFAGAIIGFVATYFTFRFLPYAEYTEPLLIENLLTSLGFALYRILVPVLATVLIAARCGAAIASDIGGKVYGEQMRALRTFGVRPERYLLTGVLYAFLLSTPVLVGICFFVAKATSLVVFTATRPEWGPEFWRLHFHQALSVPGRWVYAGTGWLAAKVLLCAAGIALVSYHRGARPKYSSRDISAGITSTILWSTLYVLVVHFAFAFYEFE